MPIYDFICPECGERTEVVRPMRDSGDEEFCDICCALMRRDYQAMHPSVRGDYNKPITSVSMAFNSQDVDEHRRKHPGVDLHVDKPGGTAYPILRSRSQKLAYLKARDWQER